MGKNGTSSKTTATPRLRFPEFRKAEGWNPRLLGDIIAERSEIADGTAPLYSLTIENGVTAKTDRYERSFLVTNKADAYKLVYPNDFAINPMNLRFGAIGRHSGSNPVALSKYYDIFYCDDSVDLKFLELYFKSDQMVAFYDLMSTGTLVEKRRVHFDRFLKFNISFPSVAEQQKIADCLTSLDELIGAQGRQVAALAAHKRGLMQQLFPRESESRPRLRFPEFDDDWQPTTLGKLVEIQSGGTPSKANPAFWAGSIPWVSAKDMKRLFLDDSEDHISQEAIDDGARLVPVGTLLILTRGMTLLKDVPICVVRREMTFNQDVKALRPNETTDGLFLAFMLLGSKDRLLKMVDIAGHGTGKLNTDELRAFELMTPSPAEQQRIAACLSGLDARLAAASEKLAALKTHRKGLMQQLFPAAAEGD